MQHMQHHRPHQSHQRERAVIRIKKELQQSELPPSCSVQPLPSDPSSLLHWQVCMLGPPESPFEGVTLFFELEVPPAYPFKPPRVTCRSRVWHPNVCPRSGQVRLSIVGEDWRPTLSLSTALFGVQLALLEANLEVAVNAAAAESYTHDPELYQAQVRECLGGTGAWDNNSSSSSNTCNNSSSISSHLNLLPTLLSPLPRLRSLSPSVSLGASYGKGSPTGNGGASGELGSARKRKSLHQVDPPDRDLEAMCIEDDCNSTSTSSTYPPIPARVKSPTENDKPSRLSHSSLHNKRVRSVGAMGTGSGSSGQQELSMLASLNPLPSPVSPHHQQQLHHAAPYHQHHHHQHHQQHVGPGVSSFSMPEVMMGTSAPAMADPPPAS